MEWSDSGAAEKKAKGKPKLLSGIKFMPHTGVKRLVRTLKEKDFKTRCKLMACRMRKEGSTIQYVCSFLGLPYPTVRDWLVLMHGRGLADRFSRHRRGRKRILDNAALKNLRA